MTLAITPKNASNKLVIEARAYLANSVAANITIALFQDATANALAGNIFNIQAGGISCQIDTYHSMAAGTTSSTTFKIRAGGGGAGTTTFNGAAGASLLSTVSKSYIKITEYHV